MSLLPSLYWEKQRVLGRAEKEEEGHTQQQQISQLSSLTHSIFSSSLLCLNLTLDKGQEGTGHNTKAEYTEHPASKFCHALRHLTALALATVDPRSHASSGSSALQGSMFTQVPISLTIGSLTPTIQWVAFYQYICKLGVPCRFGS